jgi:hypothetical protein
MKRSVAVPLAAFLIITTGSMSVGAADSAPADVKKDDTPKWESTLTAGVTLTRGNSKTFLATGAFATKRAWSSEELLFGASAGYGDNTVSANGAEVDTVTDSYIRGYGQWNHLFSKRVYAGLRVTGEHDDVADLAYRVIGSPLAGYYFVKQTNTFLSAEIGPSAVTEKFFNQASDSYFALRLGERGEYKFPLGSKLWENVEYLPKIDDFNNYLVNAEIGASAPISKGLSLSLVLQDTYKNVPATGKLKNDMKLIAGIAYNF